MPQPSDSGESQVDQGISKQGNRRVRALLVEMAWCWLRYQPDSALTRWFNKRTQSTGTNRRARRIAIVAVARRLAIALWRYLKDGEIPKGARHVERGSADANQAPVSQQSEPVTDPQAEAIASGQSAYLVVHVIDVDIGALGEKIVVADRSCVPSLGFRPGKTTGRVRPRD